MEELKKDVKAIKVDVTTIRVEVAKNTQSLIEHMRRTELAEKRLDRMDTWIFGLLASLLVVVIGRGLL